MALTPQERRDRALQRRDQKAMEVIPPGYLLAPALETAADPCLWPLPLQLPVTGSLRHSYESLAECLRLPELAGVVLGVAAPVYLMQVGPRCGVSGTTLRAWSATFRPLQPGDRLEMSSYKAKQVSVWPLVKDPGHVPPPRAPLLLDEFGLPDHNLPPLPAAPSNPIK